MPSATRVAQESLGIERIIETHLGARRVELGASAWPTAELQRITPAIDQGLDGAIAYREIGTRSTSTKILGRGTAATIRTLQGHE